MDDVIPTIYAEMATDGENESAALVEYYTRCDQKNAQSSMKSVCIYAAGALKQFLKNAAYRLMKMEIFKSNKL